MTGVIKSNQEYKQWLIDLKKRIRQSQLKAAVKVNSELITLYWSMGKDIVEKQEKAKWGNGFITQLRRDHVNNLDFQYEGSLSKKILNGISVIIPEGKVTAIVGASGSGKTTLIKLLLGNYSATNGNITIGNSSIDRMNLYWWRSQCGAVMQDGFIFSESIAKNIAVSDEQIDIYRLQNAAKTANIDEYISNLPLGYNTIIGQEGQGLSQGQKQRILIARAVYKNPQFIFLDEATNALDANNEKIIVENLENFYKGKTVIVVAHRLSTVKNADQIIVLDGGGIVERGDHEELVQLRGKYFQLIKNQLELGN